MAQGKHNPKLADEMIAQGRKAREEGEEDTERWAEESEYVPPWLELEEIKNRFAVGGEEIIFQIFRQGPGGIKDLTYVDTVAQEIFGYDLLKSPPYNGGRFRVYIRKESGGGIQRNFLINVEPGKDATIGGAPTPDQTTASLIAAMSAGFTTLSQQIARAQQSQPAAPPLGVQDVISLMGSLRGLTAPPPSTPQQDPFDMLAKVFTMQKTMQELMPPPAGEGGDMTGYLMGKALDTLTTLATDARKKSANVTEMPPADNPAPSVPQLSAPTQSATVAPSAPFSTEIEDMNELTIKIAIYKTPLLLAAKTGSDAYPYACIVVDNFTPEQIARYIEADDWFEQLLTLLPEAATHREWFGTLREEVKIILQPEPESGSVESAGTSGASLPTS